MAGKAYEHQLFAVDEVEVGVKELGTHFGRELRVLCIILFLCSYHTQIGFEGH